MKIECDIPPAGELKYLYGPSMVDRGKFFGPGWLVYLKSTECPTYYGAHGVGDTLQAAVDHAIDQINNYLARHPQGAYNVNVGGRAPLIDLDLSDI